MLRRHNFFMRSLMEIQDEDLPNDHSLNKKGDSKQKDIHIPVIREDVAIEKNMVETGKVKIIKSVTEEDKQIDLTLLQEEIDVKTIPVNQYLDAMPEPVRYEGDTMIIPVLKEVAVVRILLEKEIHITKRKSGKNETHHVTLRSEEISIQRDTDQANKSSTDA